MSTPARELRLPTDLRAASLLTPLLLALLALLLVPAGARADVSDVAVSSSEAAEDTPFAADFDHTAFISMTLGADLTGGATIDLAGPSGTTFSTHASDYRVHAGSGVHDAASVSVSTGAVSITMDSGFTADAGDRIVISAENTRLPTTAGEYTLTAATSAEPTPVAGSFEIIADHDEAEITYVSGPNGDVLVGVEFQAPIKIRITDSYDNPIEGMEAEFTTPETAPTATFPGQLHSHSATAGEDGYITFPPLTASTKSGAWKATISLPNGTELEVHLRNRADHPAEYEADPASTPQSALLGAEFGQPLRVTVRDQYGNPVPWARVSFTLLGDPGVRGTFPDGETHINVDSQLDGVATSPPVTAGALPGDWSAEAYRAFTDGELRTVFNLTNKSEEQPPDTKAPRVRFIKKPPRKLKLRQGKRVKLKLRFRANEKASFRCKVDRKRAKACSSPLKLKLRKGKHKIRIVATDEAGNRSKPKKATIRVVKAKKKRR